jgi:hypothetical protein
MNKKEEEEDDKRERVNECAWFNVGPAWGVREEWVKKRRRK